MKTTLDLSCKALPLLFLALALPAYAQQHPSSPTTAPDAHALFADFAADWRKERDALAKALAASWMRGVSGDSVRRDLLRLTSLEARLANEPGIPFFLKDTTVSTPDEILMSVAHAYYFHTGELREPGYWLRQRPFEEVRKR